MGIFDNLPTEVSLSWASSDKGKLKAGEPEWAAQPEKVAVSISFCEQGIGFGEITFMQTPNGLFLDTEYMGAERVKRCLGMLVDKAIKDTETDREKHQLFCREWGRECGPACEICFPELKCSISPGAHGEGRCGFCDGCRSMDKVCAEMENEPDSE